MTSTVENLKGIISVVATCIGLVVIIIGITYAMDVFQLMLAMLHSPSTLAGPIQELATTFGGNAYDLALSDRTVPVAKIVALVIYCFGVFTCAFLTMALMQTGAKIVSFTIGESNAVKQLLKKAFGRRMQPEAEGDNRLAS
ncbi:MAG: hypothetical protein AB7E77_04420 [Desulfobulbus sp.]